MVLVSSFDSPRYMWQSLNFVIKVALTLLQMKALLELQRKHVQGKNMGITLILLTPQAGTPSHVFHRYAAITHYKDASSSVSPFNNSLLGSKQRL